MSSELTGIMNGCIMSMAMLVWELDKQGVLSKADFVGLLRRSANDAETNAPDRLKDIVRLDLMMIRAMANAIEGGPDAPPPRWEPAVILGGKAD